MEILSQLDDVDGIFVCCGGGGMLAGIATYVKHVRPHVRVIGVEAQDAAGMSASLTADRVVPLVKPLNLFADGAAVRHVGTETFRLCRASVDAMVVVDTDAICAAIKHAFLDTRVILEPAGALAVAGMHQYLNTNGLTQGTYVAILSGANIDFHRLRFISERADAKETLVSIEIMEKPGEFQKLHQCLTCKDDQQESGSVQVTEFSYRYHDDENAQILLSFRTTSTSSCVIQKLRTRGYDVLNLTETQNELAKVHARYLSGGISSVLDEKLYRFEFRDRPGALTEFLTHVHTKSKWNISLFHYRNHGADIGRVLIGFQVPKHEQSKFDTFLHALAYTYYDESENDMYKEFLR